MKSPRSPAISPGRSSREVHQDEQLHLSLAASTVEMERLKQELDLEKQKSSALQSQMDKVTGQGDASQLIRKALEDEVKRSTALRARVAALEKEMADLEKEKQMVADQSQRLKVIIADQNKQLIELETHLVARVEEVAELNVELNKGSKKVAKAEAMAQKAALQLFQISSGCRQAY